MSNDQIITKVKPILQKYGVTKSDLFGSFARGDFNSKSDVDLLIQTPDGMSLFDLGYLQEDLEKVLSRSVDLVDYQFINKHIKKYVFEKIVRIV